MKIKIKLETPEYRFKIYKIEIEGDEKEYYLDFHSNFRYFYERSNHPDIIKNILIPYFNSLINFHAQFYKGVEHYVRVDSNYNGGIRNIPKEIKQDFLNKVKEFVIQDMKDKIKILEDNKIEIEYERPKGELSVFVEFYNRNKNE